MNVITYCHNVYVAFPNKHISENIPNDQAFINIVFLLKWKYVALQIHCIPKQYAARSLTPIDCFKNNTLGKQCIITGSNNPDGLPYP